AKKTSKTKDDFTLHQRVLWNINSHYHGNKKKFGPKWVGPYEIIKIFNNGANYTICLIPLKGNDDNIDNPMNYIKIPKKGNNINDKASTNSDSDSDLNSKPKNIAKISEKNNKNAITNQITNNNIIIPPKFNVPRCQLKPYFDDWETTLKSIAQKDTNNNALQLLINDAENSPIENIKNAINTNNNNTKLLINKLIKSPIKTINNMINTSTITLNNSNRTDNNLSLFGLPKSKIRSNSIIHPKNTNVLTMYNDSIRKMFNKNIMINNKLLLLNEHNSLNNQFSLLMDNNKFLNSYNNNEYIISKLMCLRNLSMNKLVNKNKILLNTNIIHPLKTPQNKNKNDVIKYDQNINNDVQYLPLTRENIKLLTLKNNNDIANDVYNTNRMIYNKMKWHNNKMYISSIDTSSIGSTNNISINSNEIFNTGDLNRIPNDNSNVPIDRFDVNKVLNLLLQDISKA
ncbi:MAG: hypothetical protein GY755_22655, partial [Chloroflexi bacterium]|nr:hypothetical protein [Chloroflexota bacterium]